MQRNNVKQIVLNDLADGTMGVYITFEDGSTIDADGYMGSRTEFLFEDGKEVSHKVEPY